MNIIYYIYCMDALNCPPLWVSFGLNPGGAGVGPWRGWRAVARHYCILRRRPSTPPPPPGPAAPVAGPGATRPDRGQGGSGPTSATAPGRCSRLGPAPPARAPLDREAGWSNGGTGRIASVSLGRRAVRRRLFPRASAGLLAGVLVHRGLLAVLTCGPVGWVGIAGSRTSKTAGESPVGADSDGQQAACRSYGPSTGPCPCGRHARRKPPEKQAGGHVSQAGGRRWSGGGSR
jgi:hypothetical protein